MTAFLSAAFAAFPMLQQNFTVNLNWLGQFVRLIVEGIGIVGVGVIVFTLVLKAVTTPFDIYQRISMRKQTLIMRNMQPELEKLQKQYANDKTTYNAKMVELQKKNGYSLLGACLPMLISFVILIVAVTAFQSYAQYANLSMYREMAVSFNQAVRVYSVETQDESTVITTPFTDNTVEKIRVQSSAPEAYIYYEYEANSESEPVRKDYFIDLEKFYYSQQDSSKKEEIREFVESYLEEKSLEGVEGLTEDDACVAYFVKIGSAAAAETFRNSNNPGFLWIKNVWYPDVSYRHPIQDYKSFTQSITAKIHDDYGKQVGIADIFSPLEYENLTQDLVEEKSQPNGYFILIILTLGLMVLSQVIMMKSQKETTQYQSVDGQSGKNQQKVMLVVMLLMYVVTGFIWTAAFSIYIAVSSIFGIIITLLSNLIIDRVFQKKEEEEIKARYSRSAPGKKDGKIKK